MKKSITLLISAIILIISSAKAQIKKGEYFLGGGVSLYSQKHEGQSGFSSSTTSLAFIPKFGFGLKNSWIIGPEGGISYNGQKDKATYTNTTKSVLYHVGMFVRKFHSLNDRFGIFGEAESLYGFGNSRYTSENATGTIKSKATNNEFSLGIKPGLYVKPTNKLILEATLGMIGYSKYSYTPDVGNKSSTEYFSATLTNNVSFSLQFIL